jgi:hypothetical protein
MTLNGVDFHRRNALEKYFHTVNSRGTSAVLRYCLYQGMTFNELLNAFFYEAIDRDEKYNREHDPVIVEDVKANYRKHLLDLLDSYNECQIIEKDNKLIMMRCMREVEEVPYSEL